MGHAKLTTWGKRSSLKKMNAHPCRKCSKTKKSSSCKWTVCSWTKINYPRKPKSSEKRFIENENHWTKPFAVTINSSLHTKTGKKKLNYLNKSWNKRNQN